MGNMSTAGPPQGANYSPSGGSAAARAASVGAHQFRTISILGATGSIGESTLDVIARHPDRFAVGGLAAHRQWEKLAALCRKFRPRVAALLDPDAARRLERELAGSGLPTRVAAGPAGLAEVATLDGTDTVLAAIVGAAGLAPTLAAARA